VRSVRAFAALAVAATTVFAVEPLTIDFVADRVGAHPGGLVNWAVFVELPGDLPPGSRVVSFEGDCLPVGLLQAQTRHVHPLALKDRTAASAYGAAVAGVDLYRDDLTSEFAPRRVPVLAFSTTEGQTGRANWYDFRGTVTISAPPDELLVFARNPLDGRDSAGPVRVRTDRINHPSCDHADLAAPWFVHSPTDLAAFTDLFAAGSPLADLAEPWGLFDTADLLVFFGTYSGPCAFDWD
jgi:hypothetical protein